MLEIRADMAASVWKVLVAAGDQVAEDQPLMILESMKMEIPVVSPSTGRVAEIRAGEGISVTEGDVLAVIDEGGL